MAAFWAAILTTTITKQLFTYNLNTDVGGDVFEKVHISGICAEFFDIIANDFAAIYFKTFFL